MFLNMNKAIKSAEIVCFTRALGENSKQQILKNPDNYARLFLNPYYKLGLLFSGILTKYVEHVVPGGYFLHLIRTKFFDQALDSALQKGFSQVVILGAGYDTRALRFREKIRNVQIFELDYPFTQQRKLDIVNKHKIEYGKNCHFIPIDFKKQNISEVLSESNCFDETKKTLYLMEGVSYFLNESTMLNIFDEINDTSSNQTKFVFDYAISSFVKGDTNYYGAKKCKEFLRSISEEYTFGIEKVEAFAKKCSMRVCLDLGPSDLEGLYLKSGEDILGKMTGIYKMAVFTSSG